MACATSLDYGLLLSPSDTSLNLSKQRIAVPLSDLNAQLPTVVPWLDRLVPGVWLSPPPPKTPGGMSDVAAETRARASYAPRQGFVPWHCRALMQGWGIDCGGVRDELRAWRPLDTYEAAHLVDRAQAALEVSLLGIWLRSPAGEPRLSYQTHALGYAVSGVRAMALHWGPGSGKTRAALEWSIAIAAMRALTGEPFTPIIVTTPSNVVRHWERQVRKWTMLDPVVWTAPSVRRKKDHAALDVIRTATSIVATTESFSPLVVIVSHDNVVDAWADLAALPPGVVVFDEAHLFRQTKRMSAAPTEDGGVEFSERTTAGGDRTQGNVLRDLSLWAAHGRLETTATPIGNKFAQLWVQLDLLMPGEFGSFYTWSARHAHGRAGEYGGWDTFSAANVEEHRARTRFFFYEVPVSESNRLLPAKRRETIYLPITEQVAELGGWAKVLAKSRQEGRSRELEARLMQAASRKRKYVTTRALETIAAGQKVVILTGRRKDVESIFGTLTGRLLPAKVVMADASHAERNGIGNAALNGLWWASGEVDLDERADRCDAYMQWKPEEHGGRGACLVGTLDCLGIGIDLQDTDLGLIAMLPWTWDVLWQAEGRFQRQGMTRPVLIEFVIAEGTYDEHVAQTFLSKLPAIGAATPDEEVAKVGESLRGLSNMPKLLSAIFDKIAGGTNEDEVERIADD